MMRVIRRETCPALGLGCRCRLQVMHRFCTADTSVVKQTLSRLQCPGHAKGAAHLGIQQQEEGQIRMQPGSKAACERRQIQ